MIIGINSFTTAYIIAPAAKPRRYGRIGTTNEMARSVIKAPRGSIIPDRIPSRNALLLLIPPLARGMDMIAPSGKFCIAIPRDKAKAPLSPSSVPEEIIAAYITPTAIPSGRL